MPTLDDMHFYTQAAVDVHMAFCDPMLPPHTRTEHEVVEKTAQAYEDGLDVPVTGCVSCERATANDGA